MSAYDIASITNKMETVKISKKKKIKIDQNSPGIVSTCSKFVGHSVKLYALFDYDECTTPILNCNTIGDILENVFFPRLKEQIPNIEEGPKQASPDYWTNNKEFEYEQKVFTQSPGFDISNYESYINQLSSDGGVYRKLFNTKYLIFEYDMVCEGVHIKNFRLLNVWDIVGYDGKYPITIQNKRGMWYNIRPSSVKDWNNETKTPERFIDNIIKSINECPNNICDREKIIDSISSQFTEIKSKYDI